MKNSKLKRALSFVLAFAIAFTTLVIAGPVRTKAAGTYATKISEADADSAKDSYDVTYQVKVVEDRNKGAKFDLYTLTDNGTGSEEYVKNDNTEPFNVRNLFNLFGDKYAENSFSGNFPSTVLIQAVDEGGDVRFKLQNLYVYVNGVTVLDTMHDVLKIERNYIPGHLENWQWVEGHYEGIGYDPVTYDVSKVNFPYLDKYYPALSTNETVNIPKTGTETVSTTFKGVDQYGVKYSSTNVEYSLSKTLEGVSINATTGVVTITNDANKNTDLSVDVIATVKTANSTKEAAVINVGTINLAKTKYDVKFVDYNDAVIKDTQQVTYGESATAPEDPTRVGYDFSGWDKAFNEVKSDLVVKATYSIKTFNVTFKYYDATVIGNPQTVNYGSAATAPTDPIRTGYKFVGWDKAFDNVTDNLVVTAQYEIINYTVNFVKDGTVIKSLTKNIETPINAIDIPVSPKTDKEGYNFLGFAEATGKVLTSDQIAALTVTSDMTFTAKYEIKQYKVKFVNEGETVKEFKVDHNGKVVANNFPADPTKEGYDFIGWADEDGNVIDATQNINIVVTSDRTFTATYRIRTFTVNFIADSIDFVKSVTVDYGSDAEAPTTGYEREGYEFKGWDKDFTNVKTNLDVNAIYEIITYIVTFVDENDNEVATDEYTVEDQEIVLPEVPEKAGYTGAWEEFDLSKLGDIVVKALYEVNEYTVTFVDENENVVATETYTIEDQEIEIPAVPEKAGYTGEWEDFDLSKLGDIVVNPIYTEVPATVIPDNTPLAPTTGGSSNNGTNGNGGNTSGNGGNTNANANTSAPVNVGTDANANINTNESPVADDLPNVEKVTLDDETPLATIETSNGTWSVIDMILCAITLAIAAFVILKKSNVIAIVVATAIAAIANIAVFFLTQDMTGSMVVVDSWTILFAGLTIVSIASLALSSTKKKVSSKK